ncbi:MAG: DUF2135 domain-containing protein [Alphaproteobacteria bacterium]|nr:DUF2135 domain-containing protein [Alphaproteobacteria bacterium]
MKKIALFLVLCAGLIFGIGRIGFSQDTFKPLQPVDRVGRLIPPPVIVVPHIVVRPNYQPMTLQDLSVQTNVIGNVATTTYEMTFYNPNPATLEGEFVFPLTDNQTVAAVALDINGTMREGVVVEKQKARQTFEAVVRQGVDPLLVEKTAGNQFKTRIYPFTPNGTRKIRVVLEEPLTKRGASFVYQLPLTFNQTIKQFRLDITVPMQTADVPSIESTLPDFRFTRQHQAVTAHFEAQDYLLNTQLSFDVPTFNANQVFTHQANPDTYFYTTVDVPAASLEKVLPNRVAVVWDASLSGAKRDIAREKELLKSYLNKFETVDVTFVPFNMTMGSASQITFRKGDETGWNALEKAIDGIVYDGATRFERIDLKQVAADEILLFTDGLNTYGSQTGPMLPTVPVYTINSADEYAAGLMAGWANQTYGDFINLKQTDVAGALDKLTKQSLRIVAYQTADSNAEIYPPVGTVVSGNLTAAGRVRTPVEIAVQIGYGPGHVVETKTITVPTGTDNPAVARLWAARKIAALEQNPEENKEAILALGQEYSIVTENTSLLVLDSAADYFRYQITPPADLMAEYQQLVKQDLQTKTDKKQSAINDAKRQAEEVKNWWKTDFKPVIPKPEFKPLEMIENALMPRRAVMRDAAPAMAMYDVAGASFGDTLSADGMIVQENGAVIGTVVEEGRLMDMNSNLVAKSANQPTSTAKITIQQWNPEVPYLKILKNSTDEELYRDYLKLKQGYQDQPSFYFDVADEFIRRGRTEEALIVLSNIVEMKLDNVELIRIMANKLMQMKLYPDAIVLFEKITTLRGEDPQSYRDLALAYQADGQDQKALDRMYDILEKDWERFNPIKQIIFVEMNNLLGKNPKLDTSHIDPDFIFAIPVDVRIVMAWSTDNTDIDLHVVDPLKEECYYGHRATQAGGRYAHDFTQGFGPEEFMIKKAPNGKYSVRTNNFGDHRQSISGPTTIYLDLYTHYGTPAEKHERLLVRTENVKERNEIGEIVFENN